MIQNNDNVAENVANEELQLTEKFKSDGLDKYYNKLFYYKFNGEVKEGTKGYIQILLNKTNPENIIRVLESVPTYEEYKALKKKLGIAVKVIENAINEIDDAGLSMYMVSALAKIKGDK